jgi:Sec-independent protein translocase protein TatA
MFPRKNKGVSSMGGFHPLDLIIVVGVALLLFGPKTLQSLSHNVGRGMGHAKDMKEKVMAELPMDDLSRVTENIARLPTSPQKVARMLIAPALSASEPVIPATATTQEQSEQE